MAIPKIIHHTKITPQMAVIQNDAKTLTSDEARMIRRLKGRLPGWEHRLWNNAGVAELVREHYPQYLDSFLTIRRAMVQADIIKYMYMAVYGGFYFDLDYKLYKSIDDSLLSHKCVLPISRESDGEFRLGTAIFGSEPGYGFWNDFIKHIFEDRGTNEPLETLAESRVEKVTGPEGMTDFYMARRELYADAYLPPRTYFHPKTSNMGLSIAKSKDTIGVHMSWGSWRSQSKIVRIVGPVAQKITSII